MKDAPNIVVKKSIKRPSHIRAAAGVEWIAHLHKLWAIPRTERSANIRLTG